MLLPRAEQNGQDTCAAIICQPLPCQSRTRWRPCPLRGIPGCVPRHIRGNHPEIAGQINVGESAGCSSAPGIAGDDTHWWDGDG